MPIAATFDFTTEDGQILNDVAYIDTMVTVVDASSILNDYGSAEFLADRGATAAPEDQRRLVQLLVEQIEFANVIVVSKTDQVGFEQLDQVHALIKALNAEAEIIDAVHGAVDLDELLGTGLFDLEKASAMPRWAQEMAGQHPSEADTYGIESFVYRSRKPFHPQRLHELLAEPTAGLPGVIRAKGYFWLASRPDWVGALSAAGRVCHFEPVGRWWAAAPKSRWPQDAEARDAIQANWTEPYGDRHQEIVLIGQQLDRAALAAALDRCLLNFTETRKGMAAWRELADPFPGWEATPEAVAA
jgi:G3E family GTPase